ncbi:periplasmic heavy metal sensor [Tistrella bauzanensis]|uniref:Periplasmic heavy metal sensor n=1 Tax=Tistrella arctica TaxID=3133430 RepID=A0ABU9YK21_9PROT
MTRPIRHIVQHLTVERAALALSVAANLLVAIYLIAWQPSPRLTADLGLRTDRVIEVIANRLPTADGERLRTIHAARAGELAALDTAFRAALIDATAEIDRREIDMDRLRAAFQTARHMRAQSADLMIESFVATIAAASPETRHQIAEDIRAGAPR